MAEPSAPPTSDDKKETEVFSEAQAADIAKKFAEYGLDPAPEIPASLLSANEIDYYIRKTGLIGPYHKGGEKIRLKKAAYEGFIGSSAYMYNDHNELVSLSLAGGLRVPAEAIVFVECNLQFRLPDFIALRFNLQIRHVHRGLLLGTGPLVDPGYWGKLCIPLHNLTDREYFIPIDEGLIWVEFTKTTQKLGPGEKSMGRDPFEKEFWNIRDFIEKASTPFEKGFPTVPIRSSIPTMVAGVDERSNEAMKTANEADETSSEAKSIAQEAKIASERATNLFNRLGILGGALAIIAVVGLWCQFYSAIDAHDFGMGSKIEELRSASEDIAAKTFKQASDVAELRSKIKLLTDEVSLLRAENAQLLTFSQKVAIPPPPPNSAATLKSQ